MADTESPRIIEGLMAVRGVNRPELARRCGVTRQAVHYWWRRGFTDEQVRLCLAGLDADDATYARCGVTR